MRSNTIKTGQNQDRLIRTTNNNRNSDIANNKTALISNGDSIYGHIISGFVATQTPLAVASTVGNEFAGYELNYDNSADNSNNNMFEFTNLTTQISYPEKFEIVDFNLELTSQNSFNTSSQKYIPAQIPNIEIENNFSPKELSNLVASPTSNTIKSTAPEAYFLTTRNASNNELLDSNNKAFHKSNFNSNSNQSSSTNLQIHEQNDHKNGFLFNPAKQQTTPAFSLVHLGSTLPELTNNFTSFTNLAGDIKKINSDSNSTTDLSDTLISSELTQLSAKNLPNIENVIYTGSKNAVLTGNDLGNVLIGSRGNDILNGGKGEDKLIGGDGADYFVFSENDGNDQVLDFNVGDRILFQGSINFSEMSLIDDASGQILSINGTSIQLVGMNDLTISTDWIGFIK
jgi:Ca2+-binding RTX toxin-like protein